MPPSMTWAQALAERIGTFELDAIPGPVRERAQTCLLYTLTMTVVGQADDATSRAARAVHDAPGAATLLAHGGRRAPAAAAFCNGVVACSRGQNDTHPGSVAHAGCIVVPAVLALAQARGSSGARVLEALVAGYETLPTIALEVAGEVVARGLRATAVFGPLVAAAAAARLIGLDAERSAQALAIATQYSGGTMQCWAEGSPEWRVQVGRAAAAGVEAALLAEHGMRAARAAFEGDAGWFRAICGRVPAWPPARWHLGEMVFKPYPGCLINQAPVYLTLEAMRTHRLSSEQIASVTVTMSGRDARYPGIDQYGPFEQPTGAVMSLAFMVETAVRNGTLRKDDFDLGYGEQPLHAASRRVRLVADEQRAPWSFHVRIDTVDGRVLEAEVPDQSAFAFGWDDTVRLLSGLREEWPLPEAGQRFDALCGAVQRLAELPEVGELVAACVPAAAS